MIRLRWLGWRTKRSRFFFRTRGEFGHVFSIGLGLFVFDCYRQDW